MNGKVAMVKHWAAIPLASMGALLLLLALLASRSASSVALAPDAAHPHGAAAPVVYVDWRNQGFEDGSPDHPWNTVSEGIGAASAGAPVLIAEGIYAETVVINRSLSLSGGYAAYDGPDRWSRDILLHRTTIDGGGSGPVIAITCQCTATIGGVTILGGSAARGGGLSIQQGASVRLEQSQVSGNHATGAEPNGQGGGIYLVDASLVISETNVINNTASEAGGGLYVLRGWAQIVGSQFADNTALNQGGYGEGGGIFLEGSALALSHSQVLTNQRIVAAEASVRATHNSWSTRMSSATTAWMRRAMPAGAFMPPVLRAPCAATSFARTARCWREEWLRVTEPSPWSTTSSKAISGAACCCKPERSPTTRCGTTLPISTASMDRDFC